MLDDKRIFYREQGVSVPVREAPAHDLQEIVDHTPSECGACLIDEPAENGYWWRLRCEIELLRRERGWPI